MKDHMDNSQQSSSIGWKISSTKTDPSGSGNPERHSGRKSYELEHSLPPSATHYKWEQPLPSHPTDGKRVVPFIYLQIYRGRRWKLGVRHTIVPLVGDPIKPEVWKTGYIVKWHSKDEFESDTCYYIHYKGSINPFDPDNKMEPLVYPHARKRREILQAIKEYNNANAMGLASDEIPQ
jgi:hypothetical protein